MNKIEWVKNSTRYMLWFNDEYLARLVPHTHDLPHRSDYWKIDLWQNGKETESGVFSGWELQAHPYRKLSEAKAVAVALIAMREQR